MAWTRQGDAQTPSGRLLALVPVMVALVLTPLFFPMSGEPETVPLPHVDGRALEAAMAEDDALAAQARRSALAHEVRALGSAVRHLRSLEALEQDDRDAVLTARKDVTSALRAAVQAAGDSGLRALRATQLAAFIVEVSRFQATGEETSELKELGGAFVRRFGRAGSIRGRRVLLSAAELRSAYKTMWNASVGVEQNPALALTLDEQKVLFGLYLRLPHPADHDLARIDQARAATRDKDRCRALDEAERMAAETWRLEKIRRLGALDASYPTDFATGMVQYRRGRHAAAVRALGRWLEANPSGPYTLRARTFLRRALQAQAAFPNAPAD